MSNTTEDMTLNIDPISIPTSPPNSINIQKCPKLLINT